MIIARILLAVLLELALATSALAVDYKSAGGGSGGGSGTVTSTSADTQQFVVTDPTTTPAIEPRGVYEAGNVTGTAAIDWENGIAQGVTLTGSVTSITLANPKAGNEYKLFVKQNATGGWSFGGWPGTVTWQSGAAPSVNPLANGWTFYTLTWNATLGTYLGHTPKATSEVNCGGGDCLEMAQGAMTAGAASTVRIGPNASSRLVVSQNGGSPTLVPLCGGDIDCSDNAAPVVTKAASAFALTGYIAPTALSGNTDDWNPTSLAGASAINVTATAAINLTGIAGGSTGRVLVLNNIGANTITLKNDTTSSAANRFLFGADIALAQNQGLAIQYDATASRWRAITTPGSSGTVGFVDPGLRLSSTTAVPVTATNVTTTSTIYYTPYKSGNYSCYTGSAWTLKTITEKSLALSGLTADRNYDVFIDCDDDTLSLGTVWTDATTRAEALATQNGVLVKTADATKLYIGTIRTIATNATADGDGTITTQVGAKRFIWNMYNRVPRSMAVTDTTDNWNYTVATWRVSNGATGPLNCVEYVTGHISTRLMAQANSSVNVASNVGAAAIAGIGLDSVTVPSGLRTHGYKGGGDAVIMPLIATYNGYPGVGYHYACWLEKGADNNSQWFGDNAGTGVQTGLFGEIDG